MTMRSSFLVVPIAGLLLAFLSPSEPAKPGIKRKKRGPAAAAAATATPSVTGPWANAALLQRRLDEALDWAKAATKSDFVERPTVRASRGEDVVGFLQADMAAAFKRLGAESEEQAAGMSKALAAQLLAAYDPATNTVHVLPENAEKAAAAAGNEGLVSEPVLRLVLVRMATIAMDRQLYTEWKDALDAAPSVDALHAAGAVLEGHAQYVAKRVADRLGQVEKGFSAESFHDLVALLTAPSGGETGPFAGEANFAIVKGHDFMAMAARKRVVSKTLKNPPTERSAILDPAAYFNRSKAPPGGGLPAKVIAELDALMPAADGWKREEQAHGTEKAEAFLAPIEKQLYSAIMASFRSGKAWVSSNDTCRRVVFLLEFRGPGMAEQYVNTAKGALKRRGGTAEDGAGRDSGLPGYAGSVEVDEDGKKHTDSMQVTHEGRFVLGFIAGDDGGGREAQDDALEAAAEVLAKAQKTRKNRRER